MTTNLTNEQHHENAAQHYVQALHSGLGIYYKNAVQAALDTLHAEALADDAARTADKAADLAAYVAQQNAITDATNAPAHTLARADWLDSDLISGMFTEMNHAEIYGTDRDFAYGEQEIVSFADEDFTPMFNLD